jgi:hypothetical protein
MQQLSGLMGKIHFPVHNVAGKMYRPANLNLMQQAAKMLRSSEKAVDQIKAAEIEMAEAM